MVTETLTADGIKTDDAMVTMADYKEIHGDPVAQTDDCVVFADSHGHELSEWADALDVDYNALSEKMHKLARGVYDADGAGDAWSVDDPIVFDAETFK